jgi:hypothetical protein
MVIAGADGLVEVVDAVWGRVDLSSIITNLLVMVNCDWVMVVVEMVVVERVRMWMGR